MKTTIYNTSTLYPQVVSHDATLLASTVSPSGDTNSHE
jgi:hypothetical protein